MRREGGGGRRPGDGGSAEDDVGEALVLELAGGGLDGPLVARPVGAGTKGGGRVCLDDPPRGSFVTTPGEGGGVEPTARKAAD